jgi:hypothetical protein
MPQQGSNSTYDTIQLILNFRTGIWRGLNCYEHLEVTCKDEVIREIFGWERMFVFYNYGRYGPQDGAAKDYRTACRREETAGSFAIIHELVAVHNSFLRMFARNK